MITVFKTLQIPPTDTKGRRITVKCITTGCTRIVPFDHGAHNPNRTAIQLVYGVHPDNLTYVGQEGKYDFYATQSIT